MRASMWPRRWGRGKDEMESRRWRRRPRLQCGRDDGVAEKVQSVAEVHRLEGASMWPRRWGRGKAGLTGSSRQPAPRLQCGRDDGVAEKPGGRVIVPVALKLQCG